MVISSPNSPTVGGGTSTCPVAPGISPGRITDLRMKKLHELRELQGLLEQNVLTQEEFAKQKQMVLDSLRKLTHRGKTVTLTRMLLSILLTVIMYYYEKPCCVLLLFNYCMTLCIMLHIINSSITNPATTVLCSYLTKRRVNDGF